ncbi:hypothetical protein BKA80DRAFT_286990 [Phyllosticta citrichinensis]
MQFLFLCLFLLRHQVAAERAVAFGVGVGISARRGSGGRGSVTSKDARRDGSVVACAVEARNVVVEAGNVIEVGGVCVCKFDIAVALVTGWKRRGNSLSGRLVACRRSHLRSRRASTDGVADSTGGSGRSSSGGGGAGLRCDVCCRRLSLRRWVGGRLKRRCVRPLVHIRERLERRFRRVVVVVVEIRQQALHGQIPHVVSANAALQDRERLPQVDAVFGGDDAHLQRVAQDQVDQALLLE